MLKLKNKGHQLHLETSKQGFQFYVFSFNDDRSKTSNKTINCIFDLSLSLIFIHDGRELKCGMLLFSTYRKRNAVELVGHYNYQRRLELSS